MRVKNLVSPEDLDPLNRRLATEPKPATVVQVVIIAETPELQAVLAQFGVNVQTLAEVTQSALSGGPSHAGGALRLRVFPARVLTLLYRRLGRNSKLGLSGRPTSDVGLLATSKLYSVNNYLLAFTPQVRENTNKVHCWNKVHCSGGWNRRLHYWSDVQY